MLFWLVLLKTTGNKVVLDFCAILAPYHDICKKHILLLTNFQGTFLAVLVLANRFSSNLERQIFKLSPRRLTEILANH